MIKKDKLVYIYNSRMPIELAHGLQVVQMCSAFAETGLEVELLVPRRINPIKEDLFSYYGIKKNFVFKKIPCLDLIFLNNKNIFFWVQTLTFLFFTKIYLLFKKVDILYTREQIAGLLFKNVVLEIHSLPKKIKPFHKRVWKKAKKLVVLTEFIKTKIMADDVPASKIVVSPDGVDLKKFDIDISKNEARRRLNLPQDKKLIGYVGMLKTLGMGKGIDIALKALTKMETENINLVLVGGQQGHIDFYKKMAQNLDINDRVIFTGNVEHSLVPVYLHAFDALIAPFPENDHYSYYMSPMKIFEYMASRKPIVTTDLPSLKSLLDGVAILVRPGDAKALKEGVERVLKNPELSSSLSDKAYSKVLEYSWVKRAEKIIYEINH